MKSCPQCGFQNPADIHICMRCAASLQQICSNCGTEVPKGNKFCGQCGAKIVELQAELPDSGESQPRPNIQEQLLKNLRDKMPSTLLNKITKAYSQQLQGQRREVTILSVEIANMEAAAQELESEELYLAVDEIMQILTGVIYRYEGTIDQFSGQGLMALFGIPLNHENDPERAVRAALDMINAVKDEVENFSQRYRFEFSLRAGINTGSVIVGEMGAQNHVEYTVIGDTVNLANSLRDLAQPDQILVSFNTYQRSSPIFEFQSIVLTNLLEIYHQSRAYQPKSLRYKPGQVRGLPGLHVPMVGRVEDFNTMLVVRDRALASGESQVIMVSGEAGLGKSRLVAEFVNAPVKHQIYSFWGTCAAYMRITPYRVVADVLRSLLNVSELDPPAVQYEALRNRVEQLNLEQQDILPNMLHVMGLLQSDPILEARIRLLEPVMLQRQTQLALRTFFSAIARQRFTILVFDDLHWVDQASQQFLEYFSQVIPSSSMLLVLISRDFENNEPARLIAEAAQKHTHPPAQIQLFPLSVADSRMLVDQFISEKTEKAIILKNAIIKRAAGNPYYTEELVRILMDYGGLDYHDEIWQVTSKANDLLDEVPGTLQDIILARFDRLPVHLRQTAQRASVLGDSFANRLLKVIIQESEEELNANLAELESRDFIISTRLGNEAGYFFKHPLLQETIYKTLLRRDLRRLHFEIAQAIETGEHWLPAERNQVLAWHFGESHTPSRAIPFLLASADKASQHFANDTVIQLYRQVLGLMETTVGTPVEQIYLTQVNLGQALKFSGQFEEATHYLQEVIGLTESTGVGEVMVVKPPEVLVEALRELADIRTREGNLDRAVELLSEALEKLGEDARLENPIAWRRLADRLAWVYFRQGKLDEAHNLADLALMHLKTWEADDPITLASLYNTIGGIYWTRSRHVEAIDSVENSLSIYKDLGYQWGMSVSLTNLGVLNYSIGKWLTCVEYLERADQIRSEFGNHPERPINLINLSEALISMGDYDRARQKLETSIDLCKRLGSNIYWAYSVLTLAHLAILEDDLELARVHLDQAQDLLAPMDDANERAAQYYLYRAQIKMHQGQLADALDVANRALEIADQGGFQEKKIDVLRTIGMIYTRMDNFNLAEEWLQKSLTPQGGQFGEAQVLCELGYLYLLRAQNDPQEEWIWYQKAENVLDQAEGAFETLGARRYLQRTQMYLDMIPVNMEVTSISRDPDVITDGSQQINRLRHRLGLPDGEWHQATILSLDLVPNQKVDEELLFETVAFMLPMLQELIQENNGQILRHQNGLTAVFGAPAAHEDDPERAVETAMAIVNFSNNLYQQTQLPISIRLGVSMGRIVAGWVHADSSSEFLAAGKELQVARSLAEVAAPSRVWVTQAVYNATSFRFQFNTVPTEMVERLSDWTIFQLVGEREQMLPVRGLIGLRTVFVGRQSELESMLDVSQALFNNRGCMVWLEGDPGIGKSRLTREFQNIVVSKGVTIARGICTPRRSDIAFSVFSDMLSDALNIQPNFTPNQIYHQVNHYMGDWALDEEFRPYLELLVGVQPSGQLGEQLVSLQPEQLRRQIFVVLNRLLTRLTVNQPITMIVDDIQWIDAISADLLLYLSPLIFSHPIMFICVQRQNEASAFESVLQRIRSMSAQGLLHLQLKPLTTPDCRAMLDLFLADADIDDTVKSLIVQQSGGNPYFIEEFVRMLLEQDYLRVVRGSVEVNQALQIDRLHIPSSLETLIRSRVDSLPLTSRQLLQVAAVIGRRFSSSLLMEVADRRDLHAQLDLLQSRGMLHLAQEAGMWEFGHPMIEIIVYNTVLKAQRRILHRRTAQALEVLWRGQESEHADELAYHFGRAEEHNKSLDYLILAGERSASRYANDTARSYFEQASDLLSAVPDASDQQRWRITAGLGEVYQFTGNYDASLVVLQSGQETLLDSQVSPVQHSSLFRLMGDTYMRKGELDQAVSCHTKALEYLADLGNPGAEAEAARVYSLLGWCYFRKADLENALDAVLKAEDLAGLAGNLNALAAAENLLGGINWSRGSLEQAMRHTRQAMLHYQELGYNTGVAVALNNLAILEANSGDWNAAADSFQRGFNLRLEMGDVEGMALAKNNLANLAMDQGKLEDAVNAYRDSLAISAPFQMGYHEAASHYGLSRALLNLGQTREAEQVLKDGLLIATEVDAREVMAEMQRVQAQIYLADEKLELAELQARKALDAAVEIQGNTFESSARRILAEVLLRRDDPQQALRVLGENWERLSPNVDELENGRVYNQFTRIYQALEDVEQVNRFRTDARRIFEHLGAGFDLELLERDAQTKAKR